MGSYFTNRKSTAKVRWADENGHDWLNLQHDGVIIALHTDFPKEQAISELQTVCQRALGYEQPVEIKPMTTVDLDILPACDRRPASSTNRTSRVLGGGVIGGISNLVPHPTLSNSLSGFVEVILS